MEWISVKDRLPERVGLQDDESEYVLVAIPCKITGGYYITICGYEKDGFSAWDNFGWERKERPDVTHWMPLPKPPREDT